MDYRKEFRVDPDDKVKLEEARSRLHRQARIAGRSEEGDRGLSARSCSSSRPCSTPSTSTRSSSSCRRSTPAARTARSSTCSPRSIRRARPSPASSSRPRSSSRTIFSGASIRTRPGKGEIVDLQPFALTRTCWSPRVHKLIDKATWTARYRAHSRLRGAARRERNDDPQVLPAHQQGGAARALRPAPRRPEPQLEDQRVRLYRARAVGRLHRGVRGRDRARPAPRTRRGT